MSYLEELRSRRKTPQSAWHKLRTEIGTKKFSYFAVFEGEEDEEYYSPHLERILSGIAFRPIICDGKGGVQALYSEVVNAFGDPRNVYFFVDSDHDRFIEQGEYPEQMFNTCGYSIENYCFDKQALRDVARKCYQLNINDPIYVDLAVKIDDAFATFCDATRPIMSYVVGLRSQDQALNMDGLHFSDLFEFREEGLVSKELSIKYLLQKIGSTGSLSPKEFEEFQENLAEEEIEAICRGKLISQFLLNFLKSVPTQFANRSKFNGKPLKSKLEIGKKNLILTFGNFIDIPPRLKEFLERLRSSLSVEPN